MVTHGGKLMPDQEAFAFEAAPREAKARARQPRAAAKAKTAPTRAPREPKAAAAPEPRARPTAVDLAKRQRDISVSEFFAKNRHLLGFDNPSKALLTTVKEGVDNALDACEEAGILPDVRVEIREIAETRFSVAIEDNGPGIVRAQIPKIFGSLLYGSKFHRLRQSRGQQGIGISAAGMYGLLTTGKPIAIKTRTDPKKPAHHLELVIDTKRNEPRIKLDEDLRLGEAARHARRDRAGGGLPRRAAFRRRLHPPDLAREPARAHHLRAPEGRGARRRARLRARHRRGAARDARRSSRIPTASSSAC